MQTKLFSPLKTEHSTLGGKSSTNHHEWIISLLCNQKLQHALANTVSSRGIIFCSNCKSFVPSGTDPWK